MAVPFERDGSGTSPLERALDCYRPLVEPDDIVIVTDRRHGQAARDQAPDV